MIKTSVRFDLGHLVVIRDCLIRSLAEGCIGYLEVKDAIAVVTECEKGMDRILKAMKAEEESSEPEKPLDKQ